MAINAIGRAKFGGNPVLLNEQQRRSRRPGQQKTIRCCDLRETVMGWRSVVWALRSWGVGNEVGAINDSNDALTGGGSLYHLQFYLVRKILKEFRTLTENEREDHQA